MSDILIDICVPTCNSNPQYLRKAIDSALAQTETRWRMYIHDDASSNDVASMVEPYLRDERISWHPNTEKLGIGGNWNASMKLGSAPYVQFLFQDDWWEPWFLERALAALEQHASVGFVSLGHTYVAEGNVESMPLYKQLEEFRRKNLQPGVHNGREILRYWIARQLHPNIIGEPDFVMMRRSLMERVGPYLEDMPQNLDMEYSIRCLLETDWYYIREDCGSFRVHADATSAVNQREGKGVFDRFRCFEKLRTHLKKSDPDYARTISARNAALTDMAGKFLAKMKTGNNIQTGGTGGGAFKTFALRHPFLILGALWRAWRVSALQR